MDDQVMKDLEAKVDELAVSFRAFALAKLKRAEASGVGVSQDHQENGSNWATPQHVIAAAAQEYASCVVSGKLTKQATHNIKQYRIHM